ncbi:MAG: hypothetical protein U0X75_13000 [Acidobacteriota bacterium]
MTNQEIAAHRWIHPLAAIGDALTPFDQRVDRAFTKDSLAASWMTPQRHAGWQTPPVHLP